MRRGLVPVALVATAIAVLVVLLVTSREEEMGDTGGWTAEFFGANAPLLRDYAVPERAAALEALSHSMARAGIDWARVGFDQAVEQRQPGSINWSIPDGVVAALAANGVRTQALFIGTPAWIADPEVAPACGARAQPDDVAGWAGFVGAAVERYGRGGSFWAEHPRLRPLPIETWEIGNEQNTKVFWCPAPDPVQYGRIYDASRDAALAADPDAMVILGGLAPAFPGRVAPGDVAAGAFLREMVSAAPELAERIPAVAIHPYAGSDEEVLQTIGLFREAMREAGLDRTPMIVNEIGWHTRGSGPLPAVPAVRAGRLRALTLAARRTDCELVGFGPHAWVTAETDPADPEHWYGLADPRNGAPNESGRAYGEAIAAARSGADSDPELGRLCG